MHIAFASLILIVLSKPCHAQPIDPTRLSPVATRQVDFDRDIQPILEASCLRCHGPEKPKSRFRLDIRENALKGGANNKDDIVPGDSAHSRLIYYVSGLAPDMEMPPPGKGKPLTGTQIGLLRGWIDQGAPWSDLERPQLDVTLSPMARWTSVSGDRRKFREIEGIKEGTAGGLERFAWREPSAPGAWFSGEGHAIPRDDDYQIKAALTKADLGFARAGFETWRKYYDDTGGFAPLLPTNTFNLNQDLALRMGRAWLDLGLTLPDKPLVTAGYEYQFKTGTEATLQWGPVGTTPLFASPSDNKNIFPASKQIDEGTHIVKFDAAGEIYGWRYEDSAHVEFYKLSTTRQDLVGFPAAGTFTRVSEHDQHTQGANTISLGKPLAEWLSVSGAYYYSQLEGDASLKQNTYDASGANSFGNQWFADEISTRRVSHALSVSSLAGPWDGLTLSLAAQGEWTRQDTMGFSNLQLGNPDRPPLLPDASVNTGNLDSAIARESASLRYTTIPRTALFAEARSLQESLSRFESRPDGVAPFTYDADESIHSEEYRAGFHVSPAQRVTFGADATHSDRHTDYTRLNDSSTFSYPGFFNWRDIAENQAQARLSYRLATWARTSFTVRWQKTDFDHATRENDPGSPGGAIEGGDYESRVFSFNAVLTPLRRFYFSGTFSYSDSRVLTAQYGVDFLHPYQGHLYSVLSTAAYAVTDLTDLHCTYAFSESDYGEHNPAGLPLGIDYTRHALRAGISHRLTKALSTSLTYGFAQYREPTSGHATDYTAHSIFGLITISWP
ncbi:MAG: hypothetical protein C5B50_04835 [Verrucomicrobia bacterium]|nr:MAG: hypothetical protein C5B50_04835 [Verrucomicrobiota bacterium]